MRTLFNFVALLLPSLVLATPLQQERKVHLHRPPGLGSQSAFEQSDTTYTGGVAEVEQRSLAELYQAALKEEGTLRVAWGGDVQQSKKGVTKAFQAKYPGIKFDVVLNLSKYLDGDIEIAYENTNGTDDGVDVAVLQTTFNFPRWKSQGRLLPYKVIPWNDIYPQFVDQDGAYTGLFVFTLGQQVYNPKTTNTSSLPKTYLDFLRPEWYNKIIITYPNDDDAILYLFKLIIDKYGFDFIHSLQKQNARWVRGTATPSIYIADTNPNNDIAPESRTLNAQSISFSSSNSFTTGAAVNDFEDVYMTWPQTGAIFATTTMPESAKLFLNFLMDDEWQGVVSEGKYAARRKFDKSGIFTQSEVDPLGYSEWMADREQVEALRFKLEHIIGTAQGANPVEVW